jgi:hypothetical protein
MWNPNVPLQQWLRMYPSLKIALPYKCSCGNELNAIPYVSSEWIGIESEVCSCPLKKSFCSGFPRNKNFRVSASNFFVTPARYNESQEHGLE